MKSRIAMLAALLLAGCGGQNGNQQAANSAAGAAPAAPAGGGTLTIQPGEWEVTMQMRAAAASDLPPGVRLPQVPPTTMRTCVTPEQVSRANASFLSGSSHRPGIDCDYSHVSVAGGRIQGVSTCSGNGMQASVTMDGSFTPTSYDIDQQMQANMRGRTSSSTTHLSGRLIGECTPGEAQAAAARNGSDGR